MSNAQILLFIKIFGGLFVGVVVAYFVVSKFVNKKNTKFVASMVEGTKTSSFSMEIYYQKMYIVFVQIPLLRRYVLKMRRRLEIINLEDEYATRRQTASMIFKAFLIFIPVTIVVILFTKQNTLLMCTLLMLEVLLIETILSGMVDKVDNKLLRQQVDMFSEMRHAYHEFNLVEEAVYEVAQNDEVEVSRQADKIYEILISDDPEMELEKYYDIAPNAFLKEFAGISYLTKEFGDRVDSDGSLYLKNINNITQEMQIEILKRDKLDYVFQSLSFISIVPCLFIQAVRNWSVSNFDFTSSFYDGKLGFIAQTILLIITAVCFILVRKVKDNGSIESASSENPWQKKLYDKAFIKKIVDMFIPKKGTKDYRKVVNLLKRAASKLKMEWLYINRIAFCILIFVLTIFIIGKVHTIAIEYVYTNTSAGSSIVGMTDEEKAKAEIEVKNDNVFLDKYRGKHTTKEQLKIAVKNSPNYIDATEEEITEAVDRIYTKLQTIDNEYLQWIELILAIGFAYLGYMSPIWLLHFQVKIREMEMEDEVMQFQTIIVMLMKIERVNVEIILEWLERYAKIFKEPIIRCVNNYESGAWEALEELKNDVTFPLFIRIVESLQSAVEKIPIREAFDELDTERDYYQEKRKETNERLISKKALIGKAIGFAPMICLFVGYLIIPLVAIGLTSMSGAFSGMQTSIM